MAVEKREEATEGTMKIINIPMGISKQQQKVPPVPPPGTGYGGPVYSSNVIRGAPPPPPSMALGCKHYIK